MTAPPVRWDIFCKVVDNLGDVGVCWRLARQLAAEYNVQPRLWVDDLSAFRALCPTARELPAQMVAGVELVTWQADFTAVEVAPVVIDAFGCGLPEAYLARMTDPATVWVNLEYLSAEPWVSGCHGLASQLPGCVVPRYFFFPGFDDHTGGLLREAGLLARRDAFLADPGAVAAFLHRLQVPVTEALRVSLFCYDNPALPALLEAWAQSKQAVTLMVPAGGVARQVAHALRCQPLEPGRPVMHGALSVHGIPFLPQEAYDLLLWSADLNFVRGEDSFVRAQWAGKPFVWHIYPQEGGTHLEKLGAFLDRYTKGLDDCAKRLRDFTYGWNEGCPSKDRWQAFRDALPTVKAHGLRWAHQLAQGGSLTERLVNFCAKPL